MAELSVGSATREVAFHLVLQVVVGQPIGQAAVSLADVV